MKLPKERHVEIAAYTAASLLALPGFVVLFHAPLAGLVALVLAGWPLLVARITRSRGGCLVYPLMVLPTWLVLPVLILGAAVSSPATGEGKTYDSVVADTALFGYFFFVHAFMLLALQHRFARAEDRDMVPLGEKVAVSLFALAPLIIALGFWLYDQMEYFFRL